jgi:hypothetical protein
MEAVIERVAEELLDEEQAAALLGLPAITIAKWRCRNVGPTYYKMGGKIRYMKSDVAEFLTKSRIEPGRQLKERRKRRRGAGHE